MNRAADVAIAGVALVVSSPVLALAALAIKLDGGGPVFFRQTRVGRDGVDSNEATGSASLPERVNSLTVSRTRAAVLTARN